MASVLHVDLVEQTSAALLLRSWRDNPNEVQTRTLARAEVADLIRKAQADYYSPLPAKLQGRE